MISILLDIIVHRKTIFETNNYAIVHNGERILNEKITKFEPKT